MPALPAPDSCFALLENTRQPGSPARLYTAPVGRIVAQQPAELAAALQTLQKQTEAGLHACGYIAYEAAYVLQGLPLPAYAENNSLPLLHFELFADCQLLSPAEVKTLLDDGAEYTEHTEHTAIYDAALAANASDYAATIARIHALIAAGDTYQVNYTLPYRFNYSGSAVGLYRALRLSQRVEFAALLNFAELRVASLSPELFLRRDGNTLTTRPMKGTAARGRDMAEDEAIKAAMRNDPKSQAENLMIVDLLRNDLGRVVKTGSVKVSSLFDIETFETLHQMTSTISGELAAETGLAKILSALFPCGSITGAPKHRTMQIIAELEKQPRGVYTGAIGYVAPGGDFCFSVPIRTVISTQPGVAQMGVGSGIVHDSVAAAEYAEVQLKTRFLQGVNQGLSLLESMRLEPDGSVPALALHLQRLSRSAQTFGFTCDTDQLRLSIQRYGAQQHGSEAQRLRLALQQDGTHTLTAHAIPPLPARPTLHISDQRIDSSDLFRRHKTSQRQLYEDEYARAVASGAYEVLFLNERDEIAETARHNLFIQRGNMLFTPPLAAGALPGILRQQLIEQGRVIEQTLSLTDLKAADAIFIGNAVRGLQQVWL